MAEPAVKTQWDLTTSHLMAEGWPRGRELTPQCGATWIDGVDSALCCSLLTMLEPSFCDLHFTSFPHSTPVRSRLRLSLHVPCQISRQTAVPPTLLRCARAVGFKSRNTVRPSSAFRCTTHMLRRDKTETVGGGGGDHSPSVLQLPSAPASQARPHASLVAQQLVKEALRPSRATAPQPCAGPVHGHAYLGASLCEKLRRRYTLAVVVWRWVRITSSRLRSGARTQRVIGVNLVPAIQFFQLELD
ncbi:hypothetical protein B0H19DRAFT_1233226 [Mycena capillaripes]|nr:hypothetical protein B0H19DRAFT_1233226 [Mycena capillaripes]